MRLGVGPPSQALHPARVTCTLQLWARPSRCRGLEGDCSGGQYLGEEEEEDPAQEAVRHSCPEGSQAGNYENP